MNRDTPCCRSITEPTHPLPVALLALPTFFDSFPPTVISSRIVTYHTRHSIRADLTPRVYTLLFCQHYHAHLTSGEGQRANRIVCVGTHDPSRYLSSDRRTVAGEPEQPILFFSFLFCPNRAKTKTATCFPRICRLRKARKPTPEANQSNLFPMVNWLY